MDDWIDVMEMPYKFYENSYWLKGIFEEASKQGIGVLLNGQRGNWTISWGHALDYQALLLKSLTLIRLSREIHLFSRKYGCKEIRIFSSCWKKGISIFNRGTDEQTTLIPC